MFIIYVKYLIPKGYKGMAIFPFVLIKFKKDQSNVYFINHERIHLRQQLELLLLFFFIWYVIEFIIRLFQYKNWHLAYHNISFEKEAYQNESNLLYLNERKFWQWRHYLKS